jgi:hypothetical protein
MTENDLSTAIIFLKCHSVASLEEVLSVGRDDNSNHALFSQKRSINGALRKILKRFHDPLEVMLTCVRWSIVK